MTNDQIFVIDIMKWLTIISVVLSLPITIIGSIAFWRTGKGTAKTFSMLIERGSIVRLAAIFAIIFSTFILCVAGTLKADLTASIFSGIAGYVLGGSSRASSEPMRDENESPN